MNRDKLVAVVGHSLVPNSIGSVNGANIKIFRSPGALVSTFDSNHVLTEVLNWPHDLTILFLGGNDIKDGCIASQITNHIKDLIEKIHTNCQSHIAFVLIEHRNPPPRNRFGVTASQYNRVANSINNRLKREYKRTSYVQFLSVGAKPFQQGTTDGVHFDETTKAHLKIKFRNTIKYFVESKSQ